MKSAFEVFKEIRLIRFKYLRSLIGEKIFQSYVIFIASDKIIGFVAK